MLKNLWGQFFPEKKFFLPFNKIFILIFNIDWGESLQYENTVDIIYYLIHDAEDLIIPMQGKQGQLTEKHKHVRLVKYD